MVEARLASKLLNESKHRNSCVLWTKDKDLFRFIQPPLETHKVQVRKVNCLTLPVLARARLRSLVARADAAKP